MLARIGSEFGLLELIWNNSKLLIKFSRTFSALSIRFPTAISLVRHNAPIDGRLLSLIGISRSFTTAKTFILCVN